MVDDATLALEAQKLTTILHRAWDNAECESAYAARLVALAERAQNRHIRRSARCGDPLAQRWLALLKKVTVE